MFAALEGSWITHLIVRVKVYDTETGVKAPRSTRRVHCDARDLVQRAREVSTTLRYFYIHLPGHLSYWELNRPDTTKPQQMASPFAEDAVGGEIFW